MANWGRAFKGSNVTRTAKALLGSMQSVLHPVPLGYGASLVDLMWSGTWEGPHIQLSWSC